MGIIRIIKYKRILNARKKRYASIALSIALAHAALGTIKYKSIGNGLADISLDLEEDLKFKLAVDNTIEHKRVELNGNWSLDDDYYVLNFEKPKFDLKQMFTGKTGFEAYTQIEDNTVKFPRSRAGILINGIFCARA